MSKKGIDNITLPVYKQIMKELVPDIGTLDVSKLPVVQDASQITNTEFDKVNGKAFIDNATGYVLFPISEYDTNMSWYIAIQEDEVYRIYTFYFNDITSNIDVFIKQYPYGHDGNIFIDNLVTVQQILADDTNTLLSNVINSAELIFDDEGDWADDNTILYPAIVAGNAAYYIAFDNTSIYVIKFTKDLSIQKWVYSNEDKVYYMMASKLYMHIIGVPDSTQNIHYLKIITNKYWDKPSLRAQSPVSFINSLFGSEAYTGKDLYGELISSYYVSAVSPNLIEYYSQMPISAGGDSSEGWIIWLDGFITGSLQKIIIDDTNPGDLELVDSALNIHLN